jgi:hypothetical protein
MMGKLPPEPVRLMRIIGRSARSYAGLDPAKVNSRLGQAPFKVTLSSLTLEKSNRE